MTSRSMKAISTNVRNRRLDLRMTQKDLAEKCGLSTNYISRIERSEVSPTIDTLEKLTKALKVDSSEILPF
jgi:transcriptional regulator with XRE-family HTH domain